MDRSHRPLQRRETGLRETTRQSYIRPPTNNRSNNSSNNNNAPCPFTNCHFFSASLTQFTRHFYSQHSMVNEEPMRGFVEYWLTFYVANSYAADSGMFSSFCSICNRGNRRINQVLANEISAEEAIAHLRGHYFLPELYCTACEVWFEKEKETLHRFENHQNTQIQSTILPGENVFQDLPIQKTAYLKFFTDLFTRFEHDKSQVLRTTEAAFLEDNTSFLPSIRTILRNEYSIHDISVFASHFYECFLSLGNMTFICELILAAPNEKISICLEEVKDHFWEMMKHSKAAPALTCLVVRSNENYWRRFLHVVRAHRDEISEYNSASTTIRRLLTFAPTTEERKEALRNALILPGINIADTFKGNFKSYILQSVALQHSSATVELAKYLCSNVFNFSIDRYLTHTIRFMIRTAVKNYNVPVYKKFLFEVGESIYSLQDHHQGAYVCTCLMFNAPEFADTFIKDITKSIDWFFNQQSTEPQEIQFRNKSEMLNTALNMMPAKTATNFLSQLDERKTLQMIENRNANTVLRQLAALSDNQSAVFRVYKFVNGKELKEGYARTCRDLLCGKSKCIPRKLNTRHKF